MASLAAAFGSGAMTNSIEELSNTDVIIVIGSNTTEQHPLVGMRIIEAVKKNKAQLIVIDPRSIRLSEFAALDVRLTPGTNLALLNGILNVIVTENLVNKEFISTRTEGYDAFQAAIAKYTPEAVALLTGVDPETIRHIARLYARAKKAALVYAMGITQHVTGSMNVAALANLALLTGHIGKESSGINPLRGQNNVQGACDMGALPDVLPGYQSLEDEKVLARFASSWGPDFAHNKGLTVPELMSAAGAGGIKAIFVLGENPMLSDPDLHHVQASLQNLDFLVVQDIFLTETARLAHVVLPGCSFIEKDGTFTNTERRVQRVRQALQPPGNSRPDWDILSALIKAFGFPAGYASPGDVMEEIRSLVPSYGGITYARLEKESLQWPCPDLNHPGTKYLHQNKFTRGLGKFSINEYKEAGEQIDERYNLLLTTGRIQHHYHTGTMTRRSWALEREVSHSFIEINPADAEQLGITNNSRVKVVSRRGELDTVAVVTDKIRQGVLFMPFHFKESPVNVLTNRNLDPVAHIPELKVCPVYIEVVK